MTKKRLGIWQPDMSRETVQSLYNEGFRTLFMDFGFYWHAVDISVVPRTFEEKRVRALEFYYEDYLAFKKMGFEKFILSIGSFGMNEPDAWWKLASVKFKDCSDVIMYAGEFLEIFFEKQQGIEHNDNQPWTEIDVMNKLLGPRKQQDNRFKFDSTKRNFSLLNFIFPNDVSVSSYLFQTGKWHKGMPFVWIMGQPAWHFWNTWWYTYLNWKCNKNEITDVLLYQANLPNNTSDGWEVNIFTKIRIEKWIEKIRRRWFVFVFKH